MESLGAGQRVLLSRTNRPLRCSTTSTRSFSDSLHPFRQSLPLHTQRHVQSIPKTSPAPPIPIQSASQSSTPKTSPLSSHLRALMRLTPHPVSILTTSSLSPSSRTQHRGLTLSSMTPLSLDPDPLLSFNIRLPSSTYDSLRSTPNFLIHLLSSSPAAAHLATFFSKPLPLAANLDGPGTPQDVNTESPPDFSRGVRAVLRCTMLGDGWVVADHVVIVAKVEGIVPSARGLADEQGLIYADGTFWHLGEKLESDGSVASEATGAC